MSNVRQHVAALRPIEQTVLAAFLSGSDERLVGLRAQAAAAVVTKREHTVVGEYVNFDIPESIPAVFPPEMVLGDVNAQVEGVAHGVATLLWVSAGRISFLEFATYVGEWPQDPKLVSVGYYREEPRQPNGSYLVPTAERDLQALDRALGGKNRGVA
jgi:hypothetical protein